MSTTHAAFARSLLALEGQVLLPDRIEDASTAAERDRHALTIQANVEGLGFAFRRADFERLRALPVATQVALHTQLLPQLKDQVGVRTYTPMYPNFPQQVIEASDAELLINALIHYTGDLFGLRFVPDYPVQKRPPLREKTAPAKPLGLVDASEAVARWSRWMAAAVAWSPTQREAAAVGLAWVRAQDTTEARQALMDLTLPNRENKAVIAGALLHATRGAMDPLPTTFPNRGPTLGGVPWPLAGVTLTDALRAAAAYVGGDVSLATPSRFARIPRAVRRALLAIVAQAYGAGTVMEEAFARREAWLRLGECLHPGETKAAELEPARFCFEALRNGNRPLSWHAELDAVLTTPVTRPRVPLVADLAYKNPGYYARALRSILAWGGPAHAPALFQALQYRLHAVATTVLLNLQHALAYQGASERVVLPKGQVGKMLLTPKPAVVVDPATAAVAVTAIRQELHSRFATLPSLGKVYVDPALDRVPVPFALRSASPSLHTLARGSAVPVDPKAKVHRLFVWWHERPDLDSPAGRIDLDLSAVLLDAQFDTVAQVSWTNLRDSGITHSGDLTSAPNGAAEFIDIEPTKLPHGTRYVAMVVNCFTGQPFADLPECFAGWMSRRSPNSGELFEPRTVTHRFDLTGPGKVLMPLVLDVKRGELLWLDMPYREGHRHNSVVNQLSSISQRVRALVNLDRPTLADLFALHVESRGTAVATLEEADLALTLTAQDQKPGVAATDVATIVGDWLVER